jgi:DinB superfamily
MDGDQVREQLIALLDGRGAHMSYEEAVADFPTEAMNRRAPGVPYTPWHLLEHLRLSQQDILDYVRDPGHVSPPWPAGYWPDASAVTTPDGFAATVSGFLADRAALRALVADPSTDLTVPIPSTPGHTLMREVRLAADHNAYHTGEFAILRQVMGSWPAQRRP